LTHAGSNLRSSKSTGPWEEDDIISLYAKAAGSKPGDVVASLCRGAVGDSSRMHGDRAPWLQTALKLIDKLANCFTCDAVPCGVSLAR
jgi:hypothetical protein